MLVCRHVLVPLVGGELRLESLRVVELPDTTDARGFRVLGVQFLSGTEEVDHAIGIVCHRARAEATDHGQLVTVDVRDPHHLTGGRVRDLGVRQRLVDLDDRLFLEEGAVTRRDLDGRFRAVGQCRSEGGLEANAEGLTPLVDFLIELVVAHHLVEDGRLPRFEGLDPLHHLVLGRGGGNGATRGIGVIGIGWVVADRNHCNSGSGPRTPRMRARVGASSRAVPGFIGSCGVGPPFAPEGMNAPASWRCWTCWATCCCWTAPCTPFRASAIWAAARVIVCSSLKARRFALMLGGSLYSCMRWSA